MTQIAQAGFALGSFIPDTFFRELDEPLSQFSAGFIVAYGQPSRPIVAIPSPLELPFETQGRLADRCPAHLLNLARHLKVANQRDEPRGGHSHLADARFTGCRAGPQAERWLSQGH